MPPILNSITQTPISRWDSVVARLSAIGSGLVITMDVGGNRFTIYDDSRDEGEQWSQFFGDRSELVVIDEDTVEVTMLPNGGWSYATFTFRFSDASTADPETFTLE